MISLLHHDSSENSEVVIKFTQNAQHSSTYGYMSRNANPHLLLNGNKYETSRRPQGTSSNNHKSTSKSSVNMSQQELYHIYIYMYTYIQTCIYIYIHTHLDMYIYIYIIFKLYYAISYPMILYHMTDLNSQDSAIASQKISPCPSLWL